MKKSYVRMPLRLLTTALLLAACSSDPAAPIKKVDPVADVGPDEDTGPTNNVNPDTGPGDTGPDADPILPKTVQTTLSISAGGGRGTSSNYSTRIVVGAPTPAGEGNTVKLGAGAVQHGQ